MRSTRTVAPSTTQRPRVARWLIAAAASLLGGCLHPDTDRRLGRRDGLLRATGGLVAIERAAEIFDPGAPQVDGAPLGTRSASVGLRVVAASGPLPDLTTADADPTPGTRPGARYDAAFAPTAPVQAATTELDVSDITIRAHCLQGRVGTGAWALTAGIGTVR
jgi:hypothetical protein